MNREASLGGTVRDRRLALGYSLGQLATKVNKTAASIRAWERGDAVPSEEETAALSDALDLDADLLISLRTVSLAAAPMAVEPLDLDPVDVDVDDPWDPDAASDGEGPSGAAVDEQDESELQPEDEPPADVDDAVEANELPAAAAAADELSEDDPVEEHADIDSETQGGEALVDTVAALAAAEFADEVEGVVQSAATDAAEPEMSGSAADSGAQPAVEPTMHEAMTEAVPVVPAGAVLVVGEGTPDLRAVAAEPYAAPRSSNPVVQAWDNVVDTYHRVFDPRRRWIYRVRWVLLLIALFFMLRVLVWAGGELWDAIGDVFDGIAFAPSETPAVSN